MFYTDCCLHGDGKACPRPLNIHAVFVLLDHGVSHWCNLVLSRVRKNLLCKLVQMYSFDAAIKKFKFNNLSCVGFIYGIV